ncbi:prepilin peptidase [Maritalea porphyrae]|jgi:prepilin peptidase CpaA|uniref:A24 family peptidase n=1 Tax=Maritalea porphyrae TaxID=880732 RepID=UPI0022AFF495|nr:prepilin peptidase [Maritalea porphyrae]MCZ4271727.1 prepilin peptidase [Maritalea porphyrae]
MLMSALAVIFPLLMAFSAAYDLLTMRIPNWISLALLITFCICAVAIGMPLDIMGMHFAVGLGVLVGAFLLFIPGWIGGGDAKLAAAIGLWMGTEFALQFLLIATFLGGVLTIALLLFRAYFPVVWLPKAEWLVRLHNKEVGAPYGIALAAGAMFVYANTPLFDALTSNL